MHSLKNILKIILGIFLVISIVLSILLIGSSHGTLIFKHDEQKLLSMVSAERLGFEPSHLYSQKDVGIQIKKEVRSGNLITKSEYNIYLDEKSQMSLYTFASNQTGNSYTKKETYYKDGKTYDEKGKEGFAYTDITNTTKQIISEINALQDALVDDIQTSKEKARIHFSISPFYVIGIQYSIKEEDRTLTFKYDLSGNLRNIEIEDKDKNTQTYRIDYRNKKIEIPRPKN